MGKQVISNEQGHKQAKFFKDSIITKNDEKCSYISKEMSQRMLKWLDQFLKSTDSLVGLITNNITTLPRVHVDTFELASNMWRRAEHHRANSPMSWVEDTTADLRLETANQSNSNALKKITTNDQRWHDFAPKLAKNRNNCIVTIWKQVKQHEVKMWRLGWLSIKNCRSTSPIGHN